MPSFEELKQRYMVTRISGGSSGSGSPVIPSHANCEVMPLIHGRSYFPALKAAINSVSGSNSFIYIAGWWCDPAFSLDGPGGARLVDLLKAKAHAGVDVRVLGWVMAPEVLKSRVLREALNSGVNLGNMVRYLQNNDQTVQFILDLRAEPALAHKACLNILCHPGGAAHMKFALMGDDTKTVGFTGGIDVQPGRWDTGWYDVQAQVKGPVLQDFFTAFQEMWNEVRGRSVQSLTPYAKTADTHSGSTPALASRALVATAGGSMHVQSVRTLPQFDFPLLASAITPTNSALSFAPNGLFQIKAAWQKAIEAAQQYIYIEDQSFTSTEVMSWINTAITNNPELRVVLVTGLPDPTEAPTDTLIKAFTIAINNYLLKGIPAGSPILNQIALLSHRRLFIHTKMTLVDDHWALIGSANCMRRSLYTDMEHAVAYMDQQGLAVPNQRAQLWRSHLGSLISGLTPALAAWFAIPLRGTLGASTGALERLRLPLTPAATLDAQEQVIYDEIYDVDSTKTWGNGLARMALNHAAERITGS